ncbi:MAG: hypothetical protein ACOYT8_01780 [Candidatus Dependentiae bacterium]
MQVKYTFLFIIAFVPLLSHAYVFRVSNETNHRINVTLNEIGRWRNRTHQVDPRSTIQINTGIFCVNRIDALVPSFDFINRLQYQLELRGNACRNRNFVIRSRTVMRKSIVHHIVPQPPHPAEEIYIEEV